MNTEYKIGQTVESLVDAQGLVKGQQYRIAELSIRGSVTGGVFVTYVVSSFLVGDRLLQVRNGHMVLRGV